MPIVAGCLAVLMAYTTVGSAAALVAAAFAALVAAQLQRDPDARRAQRIIAFAAAISLVLLPLLYRTSATDVVEAGFSGFNAALFDTMIRGLAVTALGAKGSPYVAYAMLVFVVIGAIALMRRDRASAAVVVAMALLPMAMNLAALRLADHFFAVRYMTPALPAYLLLAGAGIAAVARLVMRRETLVLPIVIAAALATQGWTAARTEAFRKLDWRAIAAALRNHVRPGDVILAAEPWSEVSLRYYLGDVAGVKLIYMKGWGIAEIVTQQSPAAWLVSAGASADPGMRQWMCRYPILLSSPLEGFRLHYAPSAQHFLRERSAPPEQRAVSAALGDRGFTLRMGAEDEIVIGTGWAQPEGSAAEPFRWAVGRRATLLFPRRERRNRAIRLHAFPMTDPTLPPQNVRVSLNGNAVGAIALAPRWSDYSVEAPAAFWNDGMNTLTFDFDRANAPASSDPSSNDHRELAAAFRRVSIDDADFDSNITRRDRPLIPSMRLATDGLLQPARNAKTRFPAAQLRRDAVEALLGRLGVDPVSGWTKLVRAEVRLEDFVETIAAGSDCEDDDAFLRRAFAILLERKLNEIEQRDLLRRLRNGATREHIIDRITKAGDLGIVKRTSRPESPIRFRRALLIEKLQQRNRHFARDSEEVLELGDVDRLAFFRRQFRARGGDGVAVQVDAVGEAHERSLLHEKAITPSITFGFCGMVLMSSEVAGVCSPASANRASMARASSPSAPPSVFERPGMSSASPCTTAIRLLRQIGEEKVHRRAGGDELLHELALRHVHRHLVRFEVAVEQLHRCGGGSRPARRCAGTCFRCARRSERSSAPSSASRRGFRCAPASLRCVSPRSPCSFAISSTRSDSVPLASVSRISRRVPRLSFRQVRDRGSRRRRCVNAGE